MPLAIEKGWGYWNTTKYPYGGDFRRASENEPIAEVLEPISSSEVRVKLCSGDTAVVKKQAICTIAAAEF